MIATPDTVAPRDLETRLMVAFQRERTTKAFEALYRAAGPSLLGWIEHLHLQQRIGADPMDTLQDAFVNIYRYAGSFRADAAGGFRAWAHTIASNALRRTRRRPRAMGILFSEVDQSLPDPADGAVGPHALAADAEAIGSLRRAYAVLLLQYAAAFETLKERDRRALELVEVEGRSYAEVGEIFGVGHSNTKMIVFRARKRLRAAMARAFESSDPSSPAASEPAPVRRSA